MAPTSTKVLEQAIGQALAVVDDATREGLLQTPRRWARMFLDLTSGHDFNMAIFQNPGCDEMIVERGIPFYSLCEHHLVPFFGTAAIGYIPNERIVGISKLCRAVDKFSRSLQIQERLTQELAAFLEHELRPRGVGVVLRARHLCQEMRGIRKPGVETITSCMMGNFKDNVTTKAEFMALANRQ